MALRAGKKFHPQKRGFNEYFGFLGGAHVYLPGLPNIVFPGLQNAPGGSRRRSLRRQRAQSIAAPRPVEESEYLTDAFAREAVSFIEKHQKEPLPLPAVQRGTHADARHGQEVETFASVLDPMRRTSSR